MKKKEIFISIAEILLFNLIVLYFFYYLPSNQDIYLNLNPHPLFLLCIAIGMRYGNYIGLIGAAICSIFYIYVFLQINKDIVLLVIYFRNYKYLLLFFWSALIFGLFRDNHKAKIKKLTDEKKLQHKQYKQLEKSYKVNEKILEELKKQIVGSEESILNLYRIASRLNTLELESVFTETIGVLLRFLKADAVSIYTYNEKSGYLRLKIKAGEKGRETRSLLVKDSLGYSKVVLEKETLRWTDVNEDKFPIMCAPLIKEDTVIAVVNIEHMDFYNLSEYAFQLFKLIIDWVNKALSQATFVENLQQSKYYKDTRLYSKEAFINRKNEEIRRKEEFGLDFVFVEYKVVDLQIEEINERVNKIFRNVDIIGYDNADSILLILLPATPWDKLPAIEKRITSIFNNNIRALTPTIIKGDG
jgi:polysaccharide biosynthesis protein PelD